MPGMTPAVPIGPGAPVVAFLSLAAPVLRAGRTALLEWLVR